MKKFKISEGKERTFEGVWIPAELWIRKDLSLIEKALLIEIDSLDNDKEKGCLASNEYLANFLGKRKSWISKMISKLSKMGLIKRIYFNGRLRGLRVV